MIIFMFVCVNSVFAKETDFDGVWFGHGVMSGGGWGELCSGGNVPVYFVVKDGSATVMPGVEKFMSTVPIRKDGRINFRYEQAARMDAYYVEQRVGLVFQGRLSGNVATGSFWIGSACGSKWKAKKLSQSEAVKLREAIEDGGFDQKLVYDPEPPIIPDSPLVHEMIPVKGGCFLMGSPQSVLAVNIDDERQHRVCVDDFQMSKYEVTNHQWNDVMGSKLRNPDQPVISVSWQEVQEYIEKLNSREGGKYRLPTEAEWEYSCVEGKSGLINCGGGVTSISNRIRPVRQRKENDFGLYDLDYSVSEWTCSAYDQSYGGG
ncbi:MAG: formylglycine-generating enzyme family protein [Gammaproteobacteria bacterium]|nr:formylglycine-generating enzyme family protein [Gammaproteobacteria bacterium]